MSLGMGMDPAIKLFGSTIPLPDYEFPAAPAGVSAAAIPPTAGKKTEMGEAAADPSVFVKTKMVDESPEQENDGGRLQIATPVGGDPQGVANGGDRVEAGSGGLEKAAKRPDKVLPCPRCHSRDTKFCYFNNYNVNQPRHFCKNCQRYWTAGGATRNVPVGAGRRKNKQFASHYHQIILSADALPAFARDVSSASAASFQPSSGHSGTVLRFGPEQPLRHQSFANPKAHPEPPPLASFFDVDSSYGTPENQKPAAPCHPFPPWVVPMNPGWTGGGGGVTPATAGPSCSNPNAVQWCPTPVVSVAGFCAPSIPLQLVAAPSYWGCMPLWPATGIGSVPVAAGPSNLVPTADTTEGGGCAPGGKSTSFSMQFGEEASEPRETRADDGDQGARWSSFWSSMAVNVCHEKEEGSDTKGQEILQANPAAVPRSRTLHERT